MAACWRRLWCQVLRHKREDGGVALEFGILAPLMLFIFVFMADLGFAIYQQMALDRLLRSGAQFVMIESVKGDRNPPLDAQEVQAYLTSLKSTFELPHQGINTPLVKRFFICDFDPNTTEYNTRAAAEANCPEYFERYEMEVAMQYRGLFVGNIRIPFVSGTLQAGSDELRFFSELQILVP